MGVKAPQGNDLHPSNMKYGFHRRNSASVHGYLLSLGDRVLGEAERTALCSAKQRRPQQANAPKLCPALGGGSKGSYRFRLKDGVIRKVSTIFSFCRSVDHFRFIEASIRRSGDGFLIVFRVIIIL